MLLCIMRWEVIHGFCYADWGEDGRSNGSVLILGALLRVWLRIWVFLRWVSMSKPRYLSDQRLLSSVCGGRISLVIVS